MEADLAQLSEEVRESARVDSNGEVSWPDSSAAAAITDLAAAGRVVLGLDIRFYDSEGRFYEIAWSSFDPDRDKSPLGNADAARSAALTRLQAIDELDVPEDTVERRVLVTWK